MEDSFEFFDQEEHSYGAIDEHREAVLELAREHLAQNPGAEIATLIFEAGCPEYEALRPTYRRVHGRPLTDPVHMGIVDRTKARDLVILTAGERGRYEFDRAAPPFMRCLPVVFATKNGMRCWRYDLP